MSFNFEKGQMAGFDLSNHEFWPLTLFQEEVVFLDLANYYDLNAKNSSVILVIKFRNLP